MDLREHLLAERQRLVSDLAHIDALIASRGWAAESPKKAEPASPLPHDPMAIFQQVFAPNHAEPIAYTQEATAWLESCEAGVELKIADFKAYLVKKFGAERVNEASMRGPITKLIKNGDAEVVRPGLGKAPLVFRRVRKVDLTRLVQNLNAQSA